MTRKRDVVVTRGRTIENADNLAPTFLAQIMAQYEGTRLGRQELDAELLEDVPGALWQRAKIDTSRVTSAPDRLTRVVVAIDPAATSGPDSDETGIIVAAVDIDRRGYVLEDLSGRYPPIDWARRAVDAYHRHHADRIIAETNNGGDMVEATLRMVDRNAAYKKIHASRGKIIRAEPVAALYEQGRVHHVGSFPQLEDQMCSFAADVDRSGGSSPDRVDALVWALSELIVEGHPTWNISPRALAWARGETPVAPLHVSTPQSYSPSQADAFNQRAVSAPAYNITDVLSRET